MSDNVNPHPSVQYWRQTKNPEYQWDPWKDDGPAEYNSSFGESSKHIELNQSHIGASACQHQSCPIPSSRLTFQPWLREDSVEEPLDLFKVSSKVTPLQPEQHAGYMTPQATSLETSLRYYGVPPTTVTDDLGYGGFKFESGRRPIDQSGNDKEQDSNLVPDSQDDRLKCKHPGCTSMRRFKRKYELQRHMKKHAPPISFPCPVLGCAYQGSRSFYRADKLKVHLRMSHTDDALCHCPIQGCPMQPLPLDLLMAHANCHDQALHSTVPVLKNYKMNGSKGASKCPIGNLQSCGKWLSMAELSLHILSHPEEDRIKFRTDALEAGYDSITGQSVCPICSKGFAEAGTFALHIHLEHLLEPGSESAEHFSMFYNALPEHTSTGQKRSDIFSWRLMYDGMHKKAFSCPRCQVRLCSSHYDDGRYQGNRTQHLNMHKEDITDVVQHRQQILKHYPGLANHRIFDDLRPKSSAKVGTGANSN